MPIQDLAYRITSVFEGTGYETFQNYEVRAGFSIGWAQFTYSSGSALAVIEKYCANPFHKIMELDRYLPKLRHHDMSLPTDSTFIEVLRDALADPLMNIAQNDVATKMYWNKMQAVSIAPRGIKTVLGQCFLFDCAINQGVYHDMINLAEDSFRVPHHSQLDECDINPLDPGLHISVKVSHNGIDEYHLLNKVAEIRGERFVRLAAADSQKRGLVPRANWWLRQFQQFNIDLRGEHGVLNVNGRAVSDVR